MPWKENTILLVLMLTFLSILSLAAAAPTVRARQGWTRLKVIMWPRAARSFHLSKLLLIVKCYSWRATGRPKHTHTHTHKKKGLYKSALRASRGEGAGAPAPSAPSLHVPELKCISFILRRAVKFSFDISSLFSGCSEVQLIKGLNWK